MPKILKDLEKRILDSARELLQSESNDSFNMRDISDKCSIAIGTVYNYFPSKVALLSAVLIDDWTARRQKINQAVGQSSSFEECFGIIYDNISSYASTYRNVWMQFWKENGVYEQVSQYHQMFTLELHHLIGEIMDRYSKNDYLEYLDIMCEAMIAAAVYSRITKDQLLMLINKICDLKGDN